MYLEWYILNLSFAVFSPPLKSTSWPSRPTPTGRRCCSAVWQNPDIPWASSVGVSRPSPLLGRLRAPPAPRNGHQALHLVTCVIVLVLFFVPGNAQSLKEEPKEKKINVYKELRAFWKRYYSAHYMTLAVQSIGQQQPTPSASLRPEQSTPEIFLP